jgi:hypothetical protein
LALILKNLPGGITGPVAIGRRIFQCRLSLRRCGNRRTATNHSIGVIKEADSTIGRIADIASAIATAAEE